MSESHSDILKRAYDLVESGNPDDARSLLEPLLREDPSNPDAWWIYAYAVDDPQIARDALTKVLQLNPDYPEAASLLTSLDEQYPELRSDVKRAVPPPPETIPLDEEPLPEPDFLPPAHPAESIDDEIPEPVFDDTAETPLATRIAASSSAEAAPPQEKRSRLWVWIAAAVALVLVLLAALFVPRPETDSTEMLTQVAAATIVDMTDTGAQSAVGDGTLEAAEATGEASGTTTDAGTGTQVIIQVTPLATLSADSITPDSSQAGMEQATLDMSLITPAPVDATPTPESFEPLVLPSVVAETTETFGEIQSSETAIAADATQLASGGTPVGGDEFAQVANALNMLAVTNVAIERSETSMGQTLVVSTCTAAGVDLRETLPRVMDAIAENLEGVSPDYTAVGSRMIDCERGTILRLILVDRELADAYGIGAITQDEYQSVWVSM